MMAKFKFLKKRLTRTDLSAERSRVFFDIEIGHVKEGRVVFELVSKKDLAEDYGTL